jgi:hypothetical protein
MRPCAERVRPNQRVFGMKLWSLLSANGWLLAASAGVALGAGGCTATVQTPQPTVAAEVTAGDAVSVDAPPVDVQSYPHTEYEGRTTYYVNGRWYYPHGSRWYYYRHEPVELGRRRPYVQQAPPAYQAPPGYQPPSTYQAPPAYRPVPEAVPVR